MKQEGHESFNQTVAEACQDQDIAHHFRAEPCRVRPFSVPPSSAFVLFVVFVVQLGRITVDDGREIVSA